MTTNTEQFHLISELTLCVNKVTVEEIDSQSSLTVHAITLSLTKQNNQLIECRLTFSVNPELYQRIDKNALLNLNAEVRSPLSADNFLPSPDIKIETTLKPDLLPRLAEHASTIEEAATYILNLNTEHPSDPFFFTESWLCLSVTQPTESGEIGYRTLWAYLSPAALAQAATSGSSEEISQAIINFFTDWTQAHLSVETQKATAQTLETITNFIEQFADVNREELAKRLPSTFTETATASGQLFEEVINFFQKDDWPFTQLEGQPVLQIAFQGENGKWTCYARTRVDRQQFVFYSICPINAPENQRLAIAEFLSRANYDMVIGNFELDFADGEIRYKTSIDVEGDNLSFALIKQLVYANVKMMDTYMSGIMSVIYGNISPEEAIASVEGQPQ